MTKLKEVKEKIEIVTPFGIYNDEDKFKEEALKVCKYVKTMLGNDVIAVELTKNTILTCFEDALITWNKHCAARNYYGERITLPFEKIGFYRLQEIRKYTLALCMIALGHIRGKFDENPRGTEYLMEQGTKMKDKIFSKWSN